MHDDIAIATVTLARTPSESELIQRGLSRLSAMTLPIIAVDGGSDTTFVDAISQIPGVSVTRSPTPGLFAQVRESLRQAAALDRPFILYTESNKAEFFVDALGEFLVRARIYTARDRALGMALPSRSGESFETFPSFQRYTESIANELVQKVTGRPSDQDYTYGPRLIATSLARYIDETVPDIGWGWMTYLLVVAHRVGLNIYTETMDLPCPLDERLDNDAERLCRLRQLGDHVDAIHLAMSRQM